MWGSWLIYPIEYTCTNEETINTGINIDTVNESNTKPHDTLRDSESIHLNRFMYTDILLIPTSKKVKIDNTVVIITALHVIIWDPVTPTFLPKNQKLLNLIKVMLLVLNTLFEFYGYTSS